VAIETRHKADALAYYRQQMARGRAPRQAARMAANHVNARGGNLNADAVLRLVKEIDNV
jgi:hypothetical protein